MMHRTALTLCLLGVAAAGLAPAQRQGYSVSLEAPPVARNEAEKRVLAVLDELIAADKGYLSVPRSDGHWLRVLAEAAGAKQVVEIGTSTGISGLWFSLALLDTGGKLTTFELDPGRAAQAREHFRRAGVDSIVTVVEGDAHQNIRKLKGPIDVVFIDAEKQGYPDYFETLAPLVRPGGLVLAHNVEMRVVAENYVKAVQKRPDFDTVFFLQGGGLSVSVKKH